MTAPATTAVMAALHTGVAGGASPQALFVGGCVRNALLGCAVTDIDIATILTPPQLLPCLKDAGIKVFPTGIDHGTVTAVVGHQSFEITTLRRDVATDGRRAVVAFTTDWREDAQRRDFTMNTLLADAQGHIYDPLGRGVTDAQDGRVIFVGDPAARIAEDYLRIMRFFRFQALYGKGHADAAALAACRAGAAHIPLLSRERITQETLKILGVENPVATLTLMFDHDVALFLRGTPYQPGDLAAFCHLQQEHGSIDLWARLAVLSHFDPDRIGAHLAPSNAQMKFIRELSALARERPPIDAPRVRDMIYQYGPHLTQQYLLWVSACHGDQQVDSALWHIASTYTPPAFPLSGDDAMTIGLKPGVQMGRLLADVKSWWRGQNFAPDHQQCLDQLIERAQMQRSETQPRENL